MFNSLSRIFQHARGAPPAAPQVPAVGAPVLFEGLMCAISRIEGDKFEIISEITHTGPGHDGRVRTQPRFRTIGTIGDLVWSPRLGAWYVWGRVLSKGRGGVGVDQRQIVAELRDRKAIPARPTRQAGQGPTPGEQHGLFVDLFTSSVDWRQEIANLQRGEGLTDTARTCCARHEQGFCSKRLNHGYARRGDGDPGFDAVAKEGV